MNRFSAMCFTLLAACGTTSPVAADSAAMVLPAGCSPSDGLDDRACIQAALDAACAAGGGTVHLETGQWDITRATPVPGVSDQASLWMSCSGLALRGEGPGTVLMMSGDGYLQDWSGVWITPPTNAEPIERLSISDMTIAGDDSFNPNEQTHLISIQPITGKIAAIKNVQIHNVRLRRPVSVEDRAGDCLRFVGELAGPISFVDVAGVVFEACDRSGIAVQRQVYDSSFHDLQFVDIGKTAVDFEPTGSWPVVKRITMDNLLVLSGGISIASYQTTDVKLTNSYISGTVDVTYAKRVELIGNTIETVPTDGGDISLFIRGSEDVTATGNAIRRLASSVYGTPVKISGASGGLPSRVVFIGNQVTNDSTGPVIEIESLQDGVVSGNLLTGNDGTNMGIRVRALGRDVFGLVISQNRLRGPMLYAVFLAGSPFKVAGALVADNYSSGATGAGLRCNDPVNFTAPIVHSSNMYLGAAVAVSGCAGVSVVGSYP